MELSGIHRALRTRVARGLDVPISGVPEQVVYEAPPVSTLALCGRDFLGLKPNLCVGEGDRVSKGEVLFTDRRDPQIRFTSPASGVVASIHRGHKRSLLSLVVRREGDARVDFPAYPETALSQLSREVIRETLLAAGLWITLRTRPHGKIPHSASEASAIFVTAMDTNPLAADPKVVLQERRSELVDGLRILSRLTDGRVYLCQRSDLELHPPKIDRLQIATFDGPHPAGLVGTHIHFLEPVGPGKTVWYLNYQDAIAVGRLFRRGEYWTERVIALGGPSAKRPRLLRTQIGSSTEQMLQGELRSIPSRVISGSVLSGRMTSGPESFLGRYHLQLSVIPEAPGLATTGVHGYRNDTFSVHPSLLFRPRKSYPMTTLLHGRRAPLVPVGSFERFMPLDLLATPLLRALTVGDCERAEELGCLELEEEDLALCTFVCPSKLEYGALLRQVLDRIERET